MPTEYADNVNSSSVVKSLLRNCAAVNLKDKDDQVPLYIASRYGNLMLSQSVHVIYCYVYHCDGNKSMFFWSRLCTKNTYFLSRFNDK